MAADGAIRSRDSEATLREEDARKGTLVRVMARRKKKARAAVVFLGGSIPQGQPISVNRQGKCLSDAANIGICKCRTPTLLLQIRNVGGKRREGRTEGCLPSAAPCRPMPRRRRLLGVAARGRTAAVMTHHARQAERPVEPGAPRSAVVAVVTKRLAMTVTYPTRAYTAKGRHALARDYVRPR